MQSIELFFLVQGSKDEPYEVNFLREDDNLTATCTCTAGMIGTYCKHRTSILLGDTSAIVGGDIDRFDEIENLIPGTDVEDALVDIKELEDEMKQLKKQLTMAKKYLAQTMND